MSSTRRFLMGCLALAAFVVAVPSPTSAQRQLGSIQRTIIDQTGAVLPGVTITVTNRETGEVRTAVTNETGIYRVQSLDPGRYDVTAELSGFNKAARTDITLSVGATLGLNLTMAAGAVTEVVQVSGVSPDIQTEKAEVSSIIERQRIIDLPIAGRNPLTLATLAGHHRPPRRNRLPGTGTGHELQRQRATDGRQQRDGRRPEHQRRAVARERCCSCRTRRRSRSSRSSRITRRLSSAGTPGPPSAS